MIHIKKFIIKTIFLFSTLFIFNIESIDSNSDKILIYNKTNIHDEGYYTLYFKDMNSNDFDVITMHKNVDIISYIIDENTFYARNITSLIDEYTKDKSKEDKIYYELNGIKIDGINIFCEVDDLMKLESLVNIY